MLAGGWLSRQLLEEAKYCFTYGQFLAASILGVAFIERLFAAFVYGSGRDDLERVGGISLLREALKSAWISQEEDLRPVRPGARAAEPDRSLQATASAGHARVPGGPK